MNRNPIPLTALALLLAVPSFAQDSQEPRSEKAGAEEQEQSRQLGEVVVTATKSETEVQDVTASVKAFSQEDLKKQGHGYSPMLCTRAQACR